jgi:hypothetical protein
MMSPLMRSAWKVRAIATANGAVNALTPGDLQQPRIDRAAVATALDKFLRVYDEAPLPLRWCDDPDAARALTKRELYPAYWPDASGNLPPIFETAWRAGRRVPGQMPGRRPGGRTARLRVMYDAMVEQTLPTRLRRLIEELEDADGSAGARRSGLHRIDPDTFFPNHFLSPLSDALAAGLFYFRVELHEIICVARPSMWIADGRLHREDGPAIAWPSGQRHFFWRGVAVPAWFIEEPDRLTLARIRDTSNAEVRRCMMERFGVERFVRDAGAQLIGADRYGRLWSIPFAGGQQPYVVVEVENGTREPDGTRRHYFLRVPPTMRSAHEAVAWTYGLRPQDYAAVRRT